MDGMEKLSLKIGLNTGNVRRPRQRAETEVMTRESQDQWKQRRARKISKRLEKLITHYATFATTNIVDEESPPNRERRSDRHLGVVKSWQK